MSDSEADAASSPPPDRDGDASDHSQAHPDRSADGAEDDFDDLFGDESGGDDGGRSQARNLDDHRLDSADDEDRNEPPSDDEVNEQYVYIGADLPRTHHPKSGDKEFYLMKVPAFLAIEPTTFTPESFLQTARSGSTSSQPTESTFSGAMSTIRWRYSPSNPTELQSNARMVRWSDGSLTMQFASDACTHYKIAANPLAPPQQNPRKPTPSSGPGAKRPTGPAYDPALDSFTYLCAPSLDDGVVRILQKVTTGLTVAPPKTTSTAAFEQLRLSLKASNTRDGIGHAALPTGYKNPEIEFKAIEAAEREKARQLRRKENLQNKDKTRSSRATGTRAGRSSGFGLGDDGADDAAGGGGGSRRKSRTTRRDDYSSDEEYGGRPARRGETYDADDDFVAGSDEEEEVPDLDSDEEVPRRRSGSKRGGDGNDSDGGGGGGGGRSRKKRRVIDDDDEADDDDDE